MGRSDKVIRFIENLSITSGEHAGRPFRLRDWQKNIIRGIYDPVGPDGRRLVRTALITLPRKNGKTQLAAGLALAHLIGPESEMRGQIYSAAADRAQASLIFNECRAFIEADDELGQLVNVVSSVKRIAHYGSGSFYQAISSASRSKHGFNASATIYDELAQAPDRSLYDVLTTSTGARAEPLTIVISTQSSDPHHIMTELVNYGRQINTGEVTDPSFFATIYAAPEDADPWAEETWRACNPALGDFRSLEEMRVSAEQARRIPARESAFRALYLNQPVTLDSRFIAPADWKACAGAVDPETLRGRRCWAGLDLSSTQDLTALVLYFPDDGGAVLPFFWVPKDQLREREHSDRVPFETWHRQGLIEAPVGRAMDRLAIARRLAQLAATYDLQGIAYDRWRIEDLKKLLADEGIDLPLVAWGQGFKDMGPAVDAFEVAVLDRKLRHPSHPVLTWNVANGVVEIDPAGARKVSKRKATARVDGLVALVMAIGLWSRQPPAPTIDLERPWVLSF